MNDSLDSIRCRGGPRVLVAMAHGGAGTGQRVPSGTANLMRAEEKVGELSSRRGVASGRGAGTGLRSSHAAVLLFLLGLLLPPPATANPAGRLEPDFHGWREVRTQHFVFIFEERDASEVTQLLSICEGVYDNVTRFLHSKPHRVWIVVKGRIDEANGYTAPLPPHIDLYLAPPSEPLIGLDAANYLRLLLTHELTHYVNFEYDRGFFHNFSKIFGPAYQSVDMAFLPIWFIEGLATQAETLFTSGGRGRNPFFAMEERALLYDKSFFSLEKAAYTSNFPPSDRDWLGGYLFFQYLFKEYGQSALTAIHNDFVRFPFFGPWAAIKKVTGKSAGQIYAEMIREQEQHYAESFSIPTGRQITPSVDGSYFLPQVTDRGWYLYRFTPYKAPAIVKYDPATRAERVLIATPLSDSSSLTASRDGKKLVFSTIEQTTGRSGTIVVADLFEMDVPAARVRRITFGENLWQPRLSPDGKLLIAVQRVGAYTRLVAVGRKTGRVRPLFAVRDGIVATPAFSPDGTMIAFSLEVHGEKGIWVIPAPAGNGAAPRAVPAARAVVPLGQTGVYYPQFLDDTHLLFSSDRNGSLALYSIGVNGEGFRKVVSDPVGAWEGESIGGGNILYASERAAGFVLLEKTAVALPVAALRPSDSPPVPPKPAAHPLPAAELSRAVPYHDLPRFLGWAPLPFYYSTIASSQLILAPGFFLEGSSIMGRSSYQAAVTLRTDVLQPAVEASFGATLGTLGLTYSLSEGYVDLSSSLHEQKLIQSASLQIPLIERYLLGTESYLAVTPGVSDSLSLAAGEPFAFTPAYSPAGASSVGGSFSHNFSADLGMTFARVTGGSSFDLFPRRELLAAASAAAYPPLFADTPGTVFQGLFSISLPSPISHQVIALGLKTSYVTLPAPFVRITNPRGAFNTVFQTLPGRTLISLDYLFPIALVDVPLAYSLGIIGIAGGLHVEAAADWNPSTQAITPDSDIYAGAELAFEIAVGETSYPLGLGLAFKFNPRFTTPVDWATDIRPYIYFSTSSFATSLAPGVPAHPGFLR